MEYKSRFQLDQFPPLLPPPLLPPYSPLSSLPPSQLTRRTFFEADLIDQQREEEERKLVLAEEREKESSNGGGKGKEGGEGRKVNSAAPKCSPAISKAQLGKKGVWEEYRGCASEGWKGRKEGKEESRRNERGRGGGEEGWKGRREKERAGGEKKVREEREKGEHVGRVQGPQKKGGKVVIERKGGKIGRRRGVCVCIFVCVYMHVCVCLRLVGREEGWRGKREGKGKGEKG